MTVLAHVLERAGLATVGISPVRGQTVDARPPRMLHCQLPLGRPLGRPGDTELQTDVVTRALDLLSRTDVPVLENHPEVIEDQADLPATCPLPPRLDPDVHPAVDEARCLAAAYARNVGASGGRTVVGRLADADGIPALIERIVQLEGGATLEDVDLADGRLVAAGQDIRGYYEEAGLQLADVTGARQLESWFYRTTKTGRLHRRTQEVLTAAGADKLSWQYMLPRSQSGRPRDER